MYFPRAVLLAIYADHPAARKCAMTGSACPQCYTAEDDMADPPLGGFLEMRTDANMRDRKRALIQDLMSEDKAHRDYSVKRAKQEGVHLTFKNAWELLQQESANWIFGPHEEKDCIYQSLPQPTLHGMDEGKIAKLCRGLVEMAIACSDDPATTVSDAPECMAECRYKSTSQMYFSDILLPYCARTTAMPTGMSQDRSRSNACGEQAHAKHQRRIGRTQWVQTISSRGYGILTEETPRRRRVVH